MPSPQWSFSLFPGRALRFSRHGGPAEAAAFPFPEARNLRVRRFDGWAPVRTGAEKRLFQPRRPA